MRRALLLLVAALWAGAASGDDAVWDRLRAGGYVLLVRHAQTTPGVGDPAGFRLDDCGTQRNLSEEGRAQARRLGEIFRIHAVPIVEVRSSRWCRCVDTARLAFGRVEPWPPIDSMFGDPSREDDLKRAVTELSAQVKPPRNVILVTHGSNVLALLGVHPAMGETVAVGSADGALKIVGRIPAP